MASKPLRTSASLIVACQSLTSPVEFKILFMTRSKRGSFAGLTVFPGGAVDPHDSDPCWDRLIPQQYIPERLARVGWHTGITAIREAFEETGVTFLTTLRSNTLHSSLQSRKWRHLVHNDAKRFSEMCRTTECFPSLQRLSFWSRWVTPVVEPVRFDTKFFLLLVNDPQESAYIMEHASADGKEAVNISWMTPNQALDAFKRREITMLPPQYFTLMELSSMTFKNLQELVSDPNHERDPHPNLPVLLGQSERGNPIFELSYSNSDTLVEFVFENKIIVGFKRLGSKL